MNKLFQRIIHFTDRITNGALKSQFIEAVALQGTDEADEGKFRRLTKSTKDLTPMQYAQAAKMSFYLWQRNPLAQRLIGIIVDFIVYDMDVDIKIMKRDKDGTVTDTERLEGQEVWDKFCKDPVNNFYEELPTLVQDKLLNGELLLPVVVNPFDGSVRYGYIDTTTISNVVHDASGKQAETVFIKVPNSTEEKPIKVIRYNYEMSKEPDGEQEQKGELLDGEAFFFRVNRVMNQTRGHGELTASLDWIDGLDQFMFNNLEGAALRNAFFYSLEMTGLTEAQINTLQIAPPKPGTVKVTNEKAKWDVVSPSLNGSDTAEYTRMFKNFILGGKGLPEHYFADGGNTNLATAESMGIPTMKMFKRYQNDLKMMVKTIASFVVTRAPKEYLKLEDGEYIEVCVNMFDFERKDAAVVSTAFRDIISSLTLATTNNWISDEKAKEVVNGLLQRLGIEPEDETVEDIRENNKDRDVDDVYKNNPPNKAFSKNHEGSK